MSSENTTEELLIENNEESQETFDPSEIVEVPWEQVEKLYNQRNAVIQFEKDVSDFILQSEKQKNRLLSQLSEAERSLYSTATELQQEMSLSSDLTYELKMPASPGEKAYFIRKDS